MMNEVITTIVSRRSIRKFTDEKVSKESIKLLLTAAMNAPSACNQQIKFFIVVTDKRKLHELSTLHSGVNFVKDAQAAIIVCAEPSKATLDYYWVDDCAAATENLLLAAHSIGLGGTWTGIGHTDSDAIQFFRKTLDIPDQYIPFAMIPIGYPAEQVPSVNKYDEHKVLWMS